MRSFKNFVNRPVFGEDIDKSLRLRDLHFGSPCILCGSFVVYLLFNCTLQTLTMSRQRILVCIFVISVLDGFIFFAMLLDQKILRRKTRNEALWTNDVTVPVVLGKINPNGKYAVFSTTSNTSDAQSLGFIFLLPLTVLAWKRIGFDSLIIIVGSENVWNSDPLMYMVLTYIRKLDAIVIFLNAHPENTVMVSQVGHTQIQQTFLKFN